MATETNVDAKDLFNQLIAAGAVTTQVVLIQHDPQNDLYNCSLVARGYDVYGKQVSDDKELCPPPCRVGGAFKPNA